MRTEENFSRRFPATVFAFILTVCVVPQHEGRAQTASITPLAIPAAGSLNVTAQNQAGQVAGYYYSVDGLSQRAFLWSAGVVYDLGTLGGANAVANGLNASGSVAGYSSLAGETEFHAFLFSSGALNDLGTLGGPISTAIAVNDTGQAAGYSHVPANGLDYHAFLASGGRLTDLSTLGGSFSSPVAINNSGQVAGVAGTTGDAQTHAFFYSNGAMLDLGTFGGTASSASDLNDAGQVVGDANTANDLETHAYLFSAGTIQDLGTLGGTFSTGYAINGLGQVIGDASLPGDREYHGFIYTGGAVQDVGTLGGHYSTAWGLNNLGQVVGISSNAFNLQRAFLWQNGLMVDLNTFLPSGSGWELTAAFYLNDAGQIVGYGNYQGQFSWFLMTLQLKTNHPPQANAGPDQAVEATGINTTVVLDGSQSSDPDADPLTFEWREGNTVLGGTAKLSVGLALGAHTFTLKVTDSHGASAQATVAVNVVDTTPPIVQAPAPVTETAGSNCQAPIPDFLSNLVASDNYTAAPALVKTQSPAAGTWVDLGTHVVTITVTDGAGNHTACTTTVTIVDRTAPEIISLTATPRVLYPPNHRLVPVTLKVFAKDGCDPAPISKIVSVTSSEPVTGHGDRTSPDWVITGNLSLKLRAEITAKDRLRVYTIKVACTDAAGNRSTKTVQVTVKRQHDDRSDADSRRHHDDDDR
jgi:probable HAF family extracellular repeat protein